MESRFTLKDFVFLALFVVMIGAVCLVGWMFHYQETRLNDVKGAIGQLADVQKQQLTVLGRIDNALRNGVTVGGAGGAGAGTQGGTEGQIRRTNPDGSAYVYYPHPPRPPRDPHDAADYAGGDWLVQNLGTEPQVLTPLIVKDASASDVQSPVLDSLLTQNPETFLWEPLLAESYEIKPGGLQILFKLRSGLTFSDGVPLTVDDVLFSYQTMMTPDIDCAPLRGFYQHVKTLKKVDDRTVEFDFDEPYFQSLEVAGTLQVIPKHIYQFDSPAQYNQRNGTLVGSGPYMLQKWDSGSQIVLVRNDHYWGERPTFDKVVMKFIKNPQAAFQDFQDSQLDFVSPDPDQWVKFSADQNFMSKVKAYKYQRPDSGYSYIGYNEAKPEFKDKQTRRALTMLLDRPAIIHTFLKDMAVPITGPFNPLSPQDDKTIEPWPYDVEKAKALLAAAGWKLGKSGVLERDGVRFEFSLMLGNGNPLLDRIANYVKGQFELAGIRTTITPYEFSILVKKLDDRDYDATLISWTGSLEEDPYQIWHSDSIADKGSNYIDFRNAESDKLIAEGRRTLDRDKRMAIWHQWQALIHEEQPYTFLFASVSRVFIQKRFENTEPYKVGIAPYDWYVPLGAQKYR